MSLALPFWLIKSRLYHSNTWYLPRLRILNVFLGRFPWGRTGTCKHFHYPNWSALDRLRADPLKSVNLVHLFQWVYSEDDNLGITQACQLEAMLLYSMFVTWQHLRSYRNNPPPYFPPKLVPVSRQLKSHGVLCVPVLRSPICLLPYLFPLSKPKNKNASEIQKYHWSSFYFRMIGQLSQFQKTIKTSEKFTCPLVF